MKKLRLALVSLLLLAGCDTKSVDGTKERAAAESEASKDVENSNLAKKSEKMEAELAARHRYYSALEGKFEGDVDVNGQDYRMRVTLIRSIPPYSGERVRQLSEIESDLNNLHFNVHVVQWDPADENTAVGCRLSQVKPILGKGVISITGNDCPSTYTFYLSKEGRSDATKENLAKDIAEGLGRGQSGSVGRLVGTIQPSWNAHTYSLDIKRTN